MIDFARDKKLSVMNTWFKHLIIINTPCTQTILMVPEKHWTISYVPIGIYTELAADEIPKKVPDHSKLPW